MIKSTIQYREKTIKVKEGEITIYCIVIDLEILKISSIMEYFHKNDIVYDYNDTSKTIVIENMTFRIYGILNLEFLDSTNKEHILALRLLLP